MLGKHYVDLCAIRFDFCALRMVEDNRYDKHLAECIGILWKKYPNQRFGQLMLNMVREAYPEETRGEPSRTEHILWNMENDKLSELIWDATMGDK